MKDAISTRQACVLLSLMLFCSKLTSLPALIYQKVSLNSIFSILLWLLFEFGFILAFIYLKQKYNNVSFFDILKKKIGKIIPNIIYFLIFVYFLFQMLFLISESYIYLKETVFDEADFLVFILCVLPVINTFVFNGLRALGRTAEFYYFLIIIGILFCIALGISSISGVKVGFANSFNFPQAITGVFTYSFWFGNLLFLLIIMDKIKIKNNYGKKLLKYYVLTSLIIILLFLTYYLLYATTAEIHNNSFSDIVHFSTNIGNVGKIEILPILTYMFIMYFQIGVLFYCCYDCIKHVFNINNRIMILIINNSLILILRYYLFYNREVLTNLFINVGKYYATFLQIFSLILMLWLFFSKKVELKRQSRVLA